MSHTKTASRWRETKAKFRRCYVRFGGSSYSIDDSSLRDLPGLVHLPQWSAGDIKSFIRATKLCKECWAVFDPIIEPPESSRISDFYYHHDSYDSLLRCADSGCRVCAVLARKTKTWLSAETNGNRYGNRLCSWWCRGLTLGQGCFQFLIGDPTCAGEGRLESLWTLNGWGCRTILLQQLLESEQMTNLCGSLINLIPSSTQHQPQAVLTSHWQRAGSGLVLANLTRNVRTIENEQVRVFKDQEDFCEFAITKRRSYNLSKELMCRTIHM